MGIGLPPLLTSHPAQLLQVLQITTSSQSHPPHGGAHATPRQAGRAREGGRGSSLGMWGVRGKVEKSCVGCRRASQCCASRLRIKQCFGAQGGSSGGHPSSVMLCHIQGARHPSDNPFPLGAQCDGTAHSALKLSLTTSDLFH